MFHITGASENVTSSVDVISPRCASAKKKTSNDTGPQKNWLIKKRDYHLQIKRFGAPFQVIFLLSQCEGAMMGWTRCSFQQSSGILMKDVLSPLSEAPCTLSPLAAGPVSGRPASGGRLQSRTADQEDFLNKRPFSQRDVIPLPPPPPPLPPTPAGAALAAS